MVDPKIFLAVHKYLPLSSDFTLEMVTVLSPLSILTMSLFVSRLPSLDHVTAGRGIPSTLHVNVNVESSKTVTLPPMSAVTGLGTLTDITLIVENAIWGFCPAADEKNIGCIINDTTEKRLNCLLYPLFQVVFLYPHVWEVSAVGKISDYKLEGPWQGLGQNFRRPSFATLSVDRDVKSLVSSLNLLLRDLKEPTHLSIGVG